MATGSFIEMFMTLFGWHLYDIVWDVIASTGLAYLPILAVIIQNVVKPIESQESRSAAAISLRRLEVDIVRIVLFLFVAVVPSITLNFSSVSHWKACENTTVQGGSTGTTLESALSPTLLNGAPAVVPPWFYLVISVSGGINDAIISGLPCNVADIRLAEYEVSAAEIQDTALKRSAQRFEVECYRPARAEYLNNGMTGADNDDISWLGSTYFNSHYYTNHFSKNPVDGFPYNATRDIGHSPAGGGYPSCSDWWTSLRAGLVAEFPPSKFLQIKQSMGVDITGAEDIVIKEKLYKKGAGLDFSNTGLEDTNTGDTDLMSFITDVGGAVGAIFGAALAEAIIQPTLFFVKMMAPYIQATMLMGIYFLLPWALLIGNYEWSTIKTATVTIFAIKFWTVIWAVVHLLDMRLLQAMQVNSVAGATVGFARVIVDMVILSLYLGLPFFFMSMLSWAGERTASVSNDTSGKMGAGAGDAGSKGGKLAGG